MSTAGPIHDDEGMALRPSSSLSDVCRFVAGALRDVEALSCDGTPALSAWRLPDGSFRVIAIESGDAIVEVICAPDAGLRP